MWDYHFTFTSIPVNNKKELMNLEESGHHLGTQETPELEEHMWDYHFMNNNINSLN